MNDSQNQTCDCVRVSEEYDERVDTVNADKTDVPSWYQQYANAVSRTAGVSLANDNDDADGADSTVTDDETDTSEASRPATHVLTEAIERVYGRADAYGDPEDSFARIAALWNAFLDTELELQPHEVADMMILFKLARVREGAQVADERVDIAGYAENAARLDKRCAGDVTTVSEDIDVED